MTILLIDSYDSFTYNLRSLIEKATDQQVCTIHNDTFTSTELSKYINLFDCIVIGPGPGNPHNPEDVGVIPYLFELDIPILGICLGFQALGLSQGCEVNKLKDIKHGQVYQVWHNEDSLFEGIENGFNSVRYHSLCVASLNDSLEKLAYCKDGEDEIIMAVKHQQKPWYGVQYHPESICSEFGEQLIQNFVKLANNFNKQRVIDVNSSLLQELTSKLNEEPLLKLSKETKPLNIHEIDCDKSILEICDTLNSANQDFILLNSASSPGNWSIIGLPRQDSLYITHSTDTPNKVTLTKGGNTEIKEIDSIWKFTASLMSPYLQKTEERFPFIGGLMGIFSYEEGQYIQTSPSLTNGPTPDTKLVLIEDFILRDNSTNKTYTNKLDIVDLINKQNELHILQNIPTTNITYPDEQRYKESFQKCQEYLSNGDSYELCLTTSTKINIPKHITPWDIYKTLTVKNPSPYSAFFKFDDCCLISSSPERFIHWDDSECELRPIKGTVKKSQYTREQAEEILRSPKETGENLMIVDLIRHDLFEFLKDVKVDKLMQIEEYSTVYQLVSVINGKLNNEFTGIDILSKSLPPGSMTGAPKKRSVEILQDLEGQRRGLYSGVCGYWSFHNESDWSVIIRSLFHYDDDLQGDDVWRIGAGGAITVLSECQAEWEELLTKLESALQTFI